MTTAAHDGSPFSARDSQLKSWAVALLEARIELLRRQRKRVRRNPKSEKRVHAMRTSARRLRAACSDLASIVPEADDVRKCASKLASASGTLRDCTVACTLLHELSVGLEPAESGQVEDLIAWLERCERQGRKKLARCIERNRVRNLA